MEKKNFIKMCQKLASDNNYALSKTILPLVADYRTRRRKRKLPVIWLETNDSGDNNIAFMNTTYPYLGQVFTDSQVRWKAPW